MFKTHKFAYNTNVYLNAEEIIYMSLRFKHGLFLFISGLLIGGLTVFATMNLLDFYNVVKRVYGVDEEVYKETVRMTSLVNNDDSRILELVNKNSKLDKNYVPQDLVYPNVKTVVPGKDSRNLLRRCAAEALEEMFNDASKNNVTLYLCSGFRSYDTQNVVYTDSLKKNNTGYVARPGESEHQTGLAADITCSAVNYKLDESFADSDAGIYLKNNAYKYGFVLRYPKDKESITGYSYEPWHYRFVGRDVAYYLHKDNLTIEEFYSKIK